PGEPDLTIDPVVARADLSRDVLALYDAYKSGLRFRPEDIVAPYRIDDGNDAGQQDAEGGRSFASLRMTAPFGMATPFSTTAPLSSTRPVIPGSAATKELREPT